MHPLRIADKVVDSNLIDIEQQIDNRVRSQFVKIPDPQMHELKTIFQVGDRTYHARYERGEIGAPFQVMGIVLNSLPESLFIHTQLKLDEIQDKKVAEG